MSSYKSPDDRLQSDLIRELVSAKGVARKDFDKECDRLRKQLAKDLSSTPVLCNPEVRYKDNNGHYRFRAAKAFYNWGATLGGYETIRIANVEHYGSAKLSVKPKVKAERYLNLVEANQRIVELEAELASIKRSITRSQIGAFYGKLGESN